MLALIVVGLVLLLYVIQYYRWVSRYPKGPLPLPIIGNLLSVCCSFSRQQFQYDLEAPTAYMEKMRKTYGDVFTVFLPKPQVVIAGYAHLKESFVTQGLRLSVEMHEQATSSSVGHIRRRRSSSTTTQTAAL